MKHAQDFLIIAPTGINARSSRKAAGNFPLPVNGREERNSAVGEYMDQVRCPVSNAKEIRVYCFT
jgi:hypothetical protein